MGLGKGAWRPSPLSLVQMEWQSLCSHLLAGTAEPQVVRSCLLGRMISKGRAGREAPSLTIAGDLVALNGHVVLETEVADELGGGSGLWRWSLPCSL